MSSCKITKYNFFGVIFEQALQIYLSILAEAWKPFCIWKECRSNLKGCCLHMSRCNLHLFTEQRI